MMLMDGFCRYCNSQFTGSRTTKKYCNSNCKQLYFNNQHKISLSGGMTVNSANKHESQHLKSEIKELIVDSIPDDFVANESNVEGLVDKLMLLLEKRIQSRIDAAVENFAQKKLKHKENDAIENETEQIEIIPLSDDCEGNEALTSTNNSNEKEYQKIESNFLTKIAEINGAEEAMTLTKFACPHLYWQENDIKNVHWVSVRFRCLATSLLKLCNNRYIDWEALALVSDAFYKLTNSESFKYLPTDYPYTSFILDLDEKIARLADTNMDMEWIRFRISIDKRAELMAYCYEMVHFVPLKKFSELNFEEG